MADFVEYQMMRSVRPCRFFSSTRGCRYGNFCRFQHMDGLAAAQMLGSYGMVPLMGAAPQGPVMTSPNHVYMTSASPGYYPPPMEPRGVPCRFFNTRGCRNGDRCPYLHVQEASMTSKQYNEMSEEQKNDDKSRRVRQKLPGLQVLMCGVCHGDFVRRPGGDRDIREVLKEHYEKMFYDNDPPHISYLQQEIFRREDSPVTCPAEACAEKFTDVLSLLQHLCQQADLQKNEAAARARFRHQFCLSEIARHFAWRDTLEFLNIDEFDSDEDKARTLFNFNKELFSLLNLDNSGEGGEGAEGSGVEVRVGAADVGRSYREQQEIDRQIDEQIEDQIEKQMRKELAALGRAEDDEEGGRHGFTEDEVLVLASHGILPHDPEARAALATLNQAAASY